MEDTAPAFDPAAPIDSANHPAPWTQLRPNQRLACDFALDHKRCGLFLPIGTGKSLTTLEYLYELNPSTHVLIVGPKPVMRSTWVDEIEKWGYPFRTKSLITGPRGGALSRAKRLERYEEVFTDPPTIYFISRELVSDLVDNLPKRSGRPIWPFPIVILDEAHAFKNAASKRFRALRRMLPAIDRLVELTGTPSPNGIMDLWALLYLIDGGARLGRTITEYRMRYFNAHPLDNSRGIIYTPKRGAADAVHERIRDVVLSIDGVAKTLPPVTYDDECVQLSPDERVVYDTLQEKLVLQFIDGDSVACKNKAVLASRLAQIASGTLYVNDTTEEYKVVHERKLDRTLEIVESAGSPVLVAYRFKSDRAELMRYLTERKVDVRTFDGSREMVADWNDGKIPVMLIQPASAGAGLNLQRGGHTLVWYSIPNNYEHYLQTNGRIYRTGQTEPVFIHHVMADVDAERDMMRALMRKDRQETALLECVKRVLPRYAQTIDRMLDGIEKEGEEEDE